MNRLVLAASVVALCGSSFAQSWSPLPKFQSEAGGGYQYYFGRYSNGRFQFGEGNFRNTALVVTKISMRVHPTYSYSDYYRMGRTWSNVNIDIAPCDITAMTSTFENNASSTPTACYSGAMTWPTIPIGVQSNPLSNYPIQAPLGTPYINSGTGTADMLIDFRFTGGTLANNYSWTGSGVAYYYTDSYLITSYSSGPQQFWHDSNTAGCVDSQARPLFYRSYCYQYAYRYGASYSTTSYKNTIRVYNYTYYVGPSAPYINAVDFVVNPGGIPFGSGCEKLYLAATPALMLFPGTATNTGSTSTNYFGLPNGQLPYNPAFLNLMIATQSTWNDTQTNAVMLSAGAAATIPDLGIESGAQAKRYCVYDYVHTSPGYGPYDYYYINGIIKYN